MLETLTFIAVTILAFVYVPLNLATSIFGMNLSELNGSGKRLWVFLATAIIAVLIAGTSWFLLEEGNNYRNWQLRKIALPERALRLGHEWQCSRGYGDMGIRNGPGSLVLGGAFSLTMRLG